jgi:hypothetical protein
VCVCIYVCVCICICICIYIYIYRHIAHLRQECHNSKFVTFQEKLSKVVKCYNFLCVQRRHNRSPAASFANRVMTLNLLKVHLQTFLSITITQKFQILNCDNLVAKERYTCVCVCVYKHIYTYMCVCVGVCMCACVWKRKRVRNVSFTCSLCVKLGEKTNLSSLNRSIFFPEICRCLWRFDVFYSRDDKWWMWKIEKTSTITISNGVKKSDFPWVS